MIAEPFAAFALIGYGMLAFFTASPRDKVRDLAPKIPT